MGKFIIKSVILVCLLGFGLSNMDDYFFELNSFRDTIKEYEAHEKDDLSIVFFGNSHSYSSFDPRLIELELGVESINMASAAQNLAATRVIADRVQKETKLDLAIVTLFAASFSENDSERYQSFHLLAIDNIPFSWEKLASIAEIFPFNDWPMALSETLRFHQNWADLTPIDKRFSYKDRDHYKGFITYSRSYDAKTYASFKKKYEPRNTEVLELTPQEKCKINKVIEIFRRTDTPVLFVNAPSELYEISLNHKTHAKAVGRYIRSKGIKYLDFNEIKDSLGFSKADYRNPNHLNTNGAIKASMYLSGFIEDSLKIDLKKKQDLDLSGNRYAQIISSEEELFNKKLDSLTVAKLFGIKEATLYKLDDTRYEILFPIVSDTLGFQKVRLQHDVTSEEIKAYGYQKISFNIDSTKVVFWGTLGTKDVLHLKNRNFAVFPFSTPLNELRNLSFHAGENRRVTVFKVDTLVLNKKE